MRKLKIAKQKRPLKKNLNIKKNKIHIPQEAEEIISELNFKQKQFCHFYIRDWNATKTYQKVYGVSAKVASAASIRLIGNVRIKEYIELIQKDIEKLAGISKLKIVDILLKKIYSKKTKSADQIKYIAELNKMLGYNAAEKSDIRINDLRKTTADLFPSDL